MSYKPSKLLGHPPLLAGESLASFLVRLAASNFYDSPSIFAELLLNNITEFVRDSLRYPQEASTFQRLANSTGASIRDLYSATAHSFAPVLVPPAREVEHLQLQDNDRVPLLSHEIARKLLRPETSGQYCPQCLDEAPYHRLIWLPTIVSLCLTHHCLLIRQCPNCNKVASIRNIVNHRCDSCGTDLCSAQQIHIDDQIGLDAQELFQSWLLGKDSSLPPKNSVPDHPPNVLYRVVDGLRFVVQKAAESDWPHVHILAT